MKITKQIKQRFWASVKKSRECWEWQGGLSQGYGQMSIRGKPTRMHRVSFILHFGKIPEGLCVLHNCDNRKCVRPDHLFLGTRADNNKDMRRKGRHAQGTKIGSPGEKNPNAKLTWEQVDKIRKMLLEGASQHDIAIKFRVHQTLISMIKNNQIWADYPGEK